MRQQTLRALAVPFLALGMILPGLARVARAEVVNITLLHLNDVYEITPVEGGARGGLARVATLRRQLLRANPNTYTILAGDALSPSALGTAKVKGERLAGKQMVAVLNQVGLNLATFGNHEFDLTQAQFLSRLQESRFQWFSGNVFDAQGKAFPKVPQTQVLTVSGQRERVKVGLIGVTLASNDTDYVSYRDPIEVAREQAKLLRSQVDILIAVTHLDLAQDQQLAAALPEVDLILGGHEHENIQQWRLVGQPGQPQGCSTGTVPIFKADANVRTVYIHRLRFDTQTNCLQIQSQLQPITAAIPEDPQTARVVQKWLDLGFQGFRATGFEPTAVVAATSEYLNGLEADVRNRSTNLTQLIATAMLSEVEDAQLAIFNSGSIRIDDRLPPGQITQYDVLRILPFGGNILAVEMSGKLLQQVLNQGVTNRGSGGYLQTANVTQDPAGNWLIQGQPLNQDRVYRVAINDFLVSGKEQGLSFLSLTNPDIKLIDTKVDIRFALIRQLQRQFPLPPQSRQTNRNNMPILVGQ